MEKLDLLRILNYAKENKVSELKAAKILGIKLSKKLCDLKREFGIPLKKQPPALTKDEVIEILNYCKEHGVTEKIAVKELGKNISYSLSYYKKKYNIPYNSPSVSKEIIQKILDYSKENKIPEKYAAEFFGISNHIFRYYKKQYGFKMNQIGKGDFTYRVSRVFNVNDDFFEKPNLLNCYYAGFIAADGNIDKANRRIKISLSAKDKLWLEQFKKDINYDGNICNNIVREKFNVSTISYLSEKHAQDLKEIFNITPCKSLTLQPPNISDKNLIDAFIIGYIDGDGSISYDNCKRNKQKVIQFGIVGTFEMCTWIRKRICEIIGKDVGSITKSKRYKHNTVLLTFSNKNARKIFLYLYGIDVPKLERKWSKDKYDYCINYKKIPPLCLRKGVNIFNLDGKLVKKASSLIEAQEFTGVHFCRISNLCKLNDNHHMSNGYMFSRENKIQIKPFESIVGLSKSDQLKKGIK